MKKQFYYLWFSQISSQITINLMNFLLLTRLFSITGSTIATSLLWVSYALPTIFFGPIGAVVVDSISRRKMLFVTNFLQALVVLIFYFTYESSIFLSFFVVLAYSFFNQFYVPAENALLPSVVNKEKLPKANSMFFITQQSSLIVGFGLAGFLEQYFGFSGTLIICIVLLLLATLSVYFLPKDKAGVKLPNTFEKTLSKFALSLVEGYSFIKNNKLILYPLLLLLSIQTGLAIITTNLPAIATDILGVSVFYAGAWVVVPASLGALTASLFISKRLNKDYRKKTVIENGLLTLMISIALLVSNVKVLNPLFLYLIGLGFVLVNIPTITFLQEMTPVNIRGRVFGSLWFLVTLVTIFPVIFSGVISEFFGVKSILVVMALFSLTAYLYIRIHGQKILTNNRA